MGIVIQAVGGGPLPCPSLHPLILRLVQWLALLQVHLRHLFGLHRLYFGWVARLEVGQAEGVTPL